MITLEVLMGVKLQPETNIESAEIVMGMNSIVQNVHEDSTTTRVIDYQEYRNSVLEYFDNPEHRFMSLNPKFLSLSYNQRSAKNLLANTGYFEFDGMKVPIVLTRRAEFSPSKDSYDGTIYIRVPGGPGGANIHSKFESLIYFDSDTVVIDFFYTGNGFNTIHPEPAYRIATQELAAFLREIRRRNHSAQIVLVGESLGALLSLSAYEMIHEQDISSSTIINNIILISPPFDSMNGVGDRLHKLTGNLANEDRKAPYRVRKLGPRYNEFGSIKDLDWLEVYENFYDLEEGGVELYDRISRVESRPPTLLIFGAADQRIGAELVTRFNENPIDGIELMRVSGMGHDYDPFSNGQVIKDAVAEFIDKPSS